MRTDYSTVNLCEAFGVSRSGYNAWRNRFKGKRAQENQQLIEKIRAIHGQSNCTYGSARVTHALRQEGLQVGHNRVARLMREEKLQVKHNKKFVPQTTDSHHDSPISPNHLKDANEITGINQVWQADITYIRTDEGWMFLAVIIDAYSRRALGWCMQDNMETSLIIGALTMAIATRGKIPQGIIFHSDRGSQYASEHYRQKLFSKGFVQSMSRKGNCYDNALVEAFFSRLKNECVYRHRFATRKQARLTIFEWIQAFYNLRRMHSAIGYMSPVDFENLNN
jgi:transposase InsO family protein